MSRRHSKVSIAPLALASDGRMLLNVAVRTGPLDPSKLVERAVAEGGQIFIGVVLAKKEVAFALEATDDSTAELSSWIRGARQRRRREGVRGRPQK
jgi:hypothetical protein